MKVAQVDKDARREVVDKAFDGGSEAVVRPDKFNSDESYVYVRDGNSGVARLVTDKIDAKFFESDLYPGLFGAWFKLPVAELLKKLEELS